MHRRRLLQLGLAAGATIALAGGAAALIRPGLAEGKLTIPSLAIFRAVAAAVLDGSLETMLPVRDEQLRSHLERVEAAIGAFPPSTQSELSQLLAVLAVAPGRVLVAGLRMPWPDASPQQVQEALEGMRTSSLDLRQQAFHALRDLTNAAFYADPRAWPLMGYPGPVPV